MSLQHAVRKRILRPVWRNDVRRVTNLEVTWQRMRMAICLQIPITCWIDIRTTSHSYWMYIGSVMFGSWDISTWAWSIWGWNCYWEVEKGINYNALIKFRQKWFKQEVKYYVLRSMNSLMLFIIRKNCLSSGRSHSFYL
jgi:hypothetical protein